MFAFILILLVIVFALNALDFFNVVPLDGVFERYYDKAPGVFDTLFPSHDLKALKQPNETLSAVDPAQNPVATVVPSIAPLELVTEAPTDAPTEAPVGSVG